MIEQIDFERKFYVRLEDDRFTNTIWDVGTWDGSAPPWDEGEWDAGGEWDSDGTTAIWDDRSWDDGGIWDYGAAVWDGYTLTLLERLIASNNRRLRGEQ